MFKYNSSSQINANDFIHRSRLVALISILGSILTLGFSLNMLFREMYTLAAVLVTVGTFLFISYRIAFYNKHSLLQKITRHLTLIGIILLGAFLVQSGGVNNSGPFWIFIIPPAILAFCGLFLGIFYNLIFLTIVTTLLFYPNELMLEAVYSYEFKSRLLYAFVACCLLSSFYEAACYKSYNNLNALKEKFERESKQDDLTKLSNRRYMWEILIREQDQMAKNSTLIIALLDVDYFKKINDTFGHHVGDDVLKHISSICQAEIRIQDNIARWGGEEFLVFFPNTNEKEAVILLDKIRMNIHKTPYILNNTYINISISIGFCVVSASSSLKEMIKHADHCLYEAKNTGRNKVIGNI